MLFAQEGKITNILFRENRFIKIVAIIGLITIILVNIITLLNPSRGYELSIYDAAPSIIWYGIILSSLCGIIIVVFEVYTEHYNRSSSWIYGFFIILISRITLLCLPYNRGYVAWYGDHLTHIGSVRDILTSGFISPDNYYPITHILLSEVALVTNLSIEFSTKYSTTLISVFFVVSIYLVGKYLLLDKGVTLLTLAATGCVILSHYDVYLMPNGWSILFFPFALSLILKATEREVKIAYRILTVVVLLLYPFFHTLSALMLAIILLLLVVIHAILDKFPYLSNKIREHFVLPDSAPPLSILCALVITWVAWTLSFKRFYPNIRTLYNSIFLDIDGNVLGSMGDKISKMNLDIADVIFLAINQEGAAIIFIILFIFGSYLAYNKYRKEQKFQKIVVFIGVTFSFGLLYATYLFNVLPGLGSIAGSRILEFCILMTPIFAGIVYMHILSKKETVFALLCIGMMMIPVVLSIFGAFPSPYVHMPTPDITTMDMHGAEWSFTVDKRGISYIETISNPLRFSDAILGRDQRAHRFQANFIDQIPDHFNYPMSLYFGENYLSDRYLILQKYDRILYSTVFKAIGRFTEFDFIRLKSDPSVQYLYSNGECEVYYVNALCGNGPVSDR